MLGVTDEVVPCARAPNLQFAGRAARPTVFAAVQSCSGCGFAHIDGLVFLSFAVMVPSISNSPIVPELNYFQLPASACFSCDTSLLLRVLFS